MPLVIGQDGVYVLPDGVRARFPQFATQTDAVIEPFILESRLYVDASWPSAARGLGQTFVTAHLMMLAGIGAGQVGSISMPADQSIESFRIDDISVSFRAPVTATSSTSSAPPSQWSATVAGRQYEALRKRYFGGVHFLGG